MQPAAAQGAGEEQDQGAAGGGNEPDENTVCPSGPTTHGDDRFIRYAAHADTSIPIWESRQPSHLLRRPDDRNDTVLIGAKIIHLKERRLHADAPLTVYLSPGRPLGSGPAAGPAHRVLLPRATIGDGLPGGVRLPQSGEQGRAINAARCAAPFRVGRGP